jgi:dolichol-phosphate mannosyltransferase
MPANLGLVSVIVPTYREAANLPLLVPRIARSLADAGLQGEILIVDDNSQDGTESICKELAALYPVQLVVRMNERGLASAVLHGMRLARGEIFVVMDADLSHPPEKIPELVATLASENTDFVIGSRYVAGGATADDWGVLRWLNSKIATLLARPLTAARDPLAGFFAIRRTTFEAAAPLHPLGSKIGLELMVKCGCRSVKEVPITFENRTQGQSKLTLKEQIQFVLHLIRLYEHRYRAWMQLLQFVFVGSTGVLVNMISFAFLRLALPPFTGQENTAWGMAIWIAMSWNFLLNRQVTFRDSRTRSMPVQYVLFCLSCLMGAMINWLTFVLLRNLFELFDEHWYLAAIAGIVAGTAFNFALSKRHVFN